MNKAKKVQVTCGIESVVVSVAFAVVVVDDGDEDFSDSAENANQSFVE